jgi:23S rRNA A1618 N6-methylase RlmF
MCNPPFYSNESESIGKSSNIRKPEKRKLPHSINTGCLNESVYENDGEVGFIKKMIDESIKIGKKIKYERNLKIFFCIWI